MAGTTLTLAAQPKPRVEPARAGKPGFGASLLAILGGQVASGVVALLTEVSYARFLGPASRGLISLGLMSVAFGTLVGGFGGEGTIIYWSSRAKKAYDWLPAVALWGLLGCCVACALWILTFGRVHPSFLHGMTQSSARIVLVSIPAAILFAYSMALLSGSERFRVRSVFAVLRQLAGMAAFLTAMMLFGRSTEAALFGNFIGLLAGSAVTLYLLRDSLRDFWKIGNARAELKPTLAYGLRGQAGNLATFFTYRFDVFIVNYFLPPAQLGYYALGVAVSEALWQVPQAMASALFPRTARTVEEGASQFTCFVLRQVFLLTCLGGILLAAASPFAIPAVFGASFKPSVPVIWWILPGTIALSLAKVGCADLAGRGKNGYSSVFSLVCFAVTITLDWLLIPRMGILGAALASSIAYSLNAILVLCALRHELQATWRELLIPSRKELIAYRQLWPRLREMFRPAARQPHLKTDLVSLPSE